MFDDSDFKISSFSGGDAGTCVAVAIREDAIAVRDSKAPHDATLLFTKAEWQAFVKGVKNGEFDT